MRWRSGKKASRGASGTRLEFEQLEGRLVLSGGPLWLGTSLPLGTIHASLAAVQTDGVLAASETINWYGLEAQQEGMLTADLTLAVGSDAGLRLDLANVDGQVLVTSRWGLKSSSICRRDNTTWVCQGKTRARATSL